MTITMYGADWCGDCRRAKSVLLEAGVDYDFVDIEGLPEAAAEAVKRTNGRKRIPVVVFDDGTHLVEPSNAVLEAKLGDIADAYRVVDDVDRGRFELWRGEDLISVATIRTRGDTVVVPHVETGFEHRGAGNADRLMNGLLDQLRASNRMIEPVCPFAVDYLRDHPGQQDLLATP